jgi:hypothetical protein
MALLELLNNDPKFFYYSGKGNFTQKSIPYGNDRQGGGSSNQPFEQFPLPENASSVTKNFYELNRVGNDYPLRGGSSYNVTALGNPLPEAGKYDTSRIEKFLRTSQGNIFLEKQKKLQFASPKMEVGEVAQPFGEQLGIISIGGTEYTRVYNQRALLSQVAVQGSGLHYDRVGNQLITGFQSKYYHVVKNKSADKNRLLNLFRTKIIDDPDTDLAYTFQLGISSLNNLLFEYQGGPTSAGGIGVTTIQRVENTGLNTETPNTFNYTALYNQVSEKGKIQEDFRTKIIPTFPGVASDYLTDSITIKYGIDTNTGDAIGLQRPVDIPKGDYDPWENLINGKNKDLINFGFEAINYESNNTFIQFRAFLTNFGDNHTATYSPINYVGRGETFQVYGGFTRDISFGFILAAQSKAELLPLYDKLNVFVSQLYPDYGPNSFMRTPVVKMTAGDYLYRQPGFLNSINLSIEQDYPWELESGDGSYQLPHIIKADCQFTPLHDFLPRRLTPGTAIKGNSLINQRNTTTFDASPALASTEVAVNNNVNAQETPATPATPVVPSRITDTRNNIRGITDTRNTQVGQFGTRLGTPRT